MRFNLFLRGEEITSDFKKILTPVNMTEKSQASEFSPIFKFNKKYIECIRNFSVYQNTPNINVETVKCTTAR